MHSHSDEPMSTTTGGVSDHGLKQFQDALRELGRWMDAYPDISDHERADGQAYIAGMARWAIERAFMCSDLDRPCFIRSMDPFTHWGLDNPDNIYWCADIRGNTEYLIRGERGTCADIVFEVLAGMAGDDGKLGANVDSLDAGTLQTNANGNFEIRVGGKRDDATNWLATHADASAVFVRRSFGDWTREHAGWLTIERTGVHQPIAVLPDISSVSRQWALAAKRLRDQVMFLEQLAGHWFRNLPPNEFGVPTSKGSGFLPGQFNSFGRYRIDDGMALVLTLKPAQCRYWGVQAGNIKWVCSFDYRKRQNSLNSTQALRSSDGLYRFVVGAADPGVPNWIDTAGRSEGVVFMRWQGATGIAPEQPHAALVPLAQIHSHLPDDEPTMDAESRRQSLALRTHAVDKRFST